MTYKFEKLLIATGNQGKFKEFKSYFADFPFRCVSTNGFSIDEPEENGSSFEENALIKAKYYSGMTNLPALADDSGLIVDQLDGRPGIFSARWALPNKDFSVAITKVKDELLKLGVDLSGVTGSFYCALCLYMPNGEYIEASGKVSGDISFPPRGNNGFGYDPIFIPHGEKLTFAEMPAAEKQQYSHRMRALLKLKDILQ